jgi:hypothetical protein
VTCIFAQKQYPQHLTFFNNQKNLLKPASKYCYPGKGRKLIEKKLQVVGSKKYPTLLCEKQSENFLEIGVLCDRVSKI